MEMGKRMDRIVFRIFWIPIFTVSFGMFYWLHTIDPYLTCLVLAIVVVEILCMVAHRG